MCTGKSLGKDHLGLGFLFCFVVTDILVFHLNCTDRTYPWCGIYAVHAAMFKKNPWKCGLYFYCAMWYVMM